MAPKGSINVELAEEFVDCTVRIQTSRGRVQGTLHSVNRQDQGLVFVVGTTGTSQFQSIEELSIDTLEGESEAGFVQLYPLDQPVEEGDQEDDNDPAADEPTGAPTPDSPDYVPAADGQPAADLSPEAAAAEVSEPTGEQAPEAAEDAAAEVGEDLTPQAKAAATRKRKKAEAEAAG